MCLREESIKTIFKKKEKVKFGVAIPQNFLNGHVDIGLVRESIKKSESFGYHSLWVLENVVGDTPTLEAIGLLSYAAGLSDYLQLGVSVLVTSQRNPIQLAKILGTLDHLSNGRLIVGVGIGDAVAPHGGGGKWEDPIGHLRSQLVLRSKQLFDIPAQGLVGRFIEGLEIMKALWTQPSAHYIGDFWQLDGVAMEPKPLQKPHPPIWFGGRHPDALRRAVRYGDGWMGAGATSTALFNKNVSDLGELLEEERRDPSTFFISKRVYLALDDNESRAERRLREWFGRSWYRNTDLASTVCVWGSAGKCTEQLAEIVAAGAQLLVLNPVFDHLEHLSLLAEEVMPHL